MNKGRFKAGHRAKFKDVPFIQPLRDKGYSYNNLPAILGTSKANYVLLFQEPWRMTGRQYIIISQLLCIPLAEVINTLFRTPAKSPHYLTEDYNTNIHVKTIKADLIEKGILKATTI